MKWLATVTGKRALNGAPYSVHLHGDGCDATGGADIYAVLSALADVLREANKGMEVAQEIKVWVSLQPPRR